MRYLYFVIPYVVLSSAGLVMVKMAINEGASGGGGLLDLLLTPLFLAGSVAYIVGYAFYLISLKYGDLTTIFPIACGLFFVLIALLGVLFLGEPVDTRKIFGMVIILVGCWLLV